MNEPLLEALHRTLLLMRDDLIPEMTDEALLDALTSTRVLLIGDRRSLATHAGQCAYVTAAIQLGRSGHSVYLEGPDVPLVGPQPPLRPGGLISSLLELGSDLLPDVTFTAGSPPRADLMVTLGDGAVPDLADRRVTINASAWRAYIDQVPTPWREPEFPFGAMAAATLAACEGFKVSMQRLRPYARNPRDFDRSFAFVERLAFDLAPPTTPLPLQVDFGRVDCVSGGAITNAALFALTRVRNVASEVRVIEPEASDATNLNRYALLRRSHLHRPKVETLSGLPSPDFHIEGLPLRYGPDTRTKIGELAPSVLVGVDHIPTRWEVQKAWPAWLGVGATTHWSAMASVHEAGLPCAGCLHPRDDTDQGLIPTVAFVSFWAGLLLAAYFLRHRAGLSISPAEQQIYLTSYRPDAPWRSAVARHPHCPVRSATGLDCSAPASRSRRDP